MKEFQSKTIKFKKYKFYHYIAFSSYLVHVFNRKNRQVSSAHNVSNTRLDMQNLTHGTFSSMF